MILEVSHNCIDYHGGLEPIALAMLAVARHAPGPVAVHLDHARTADLVREAVALGIGSVMFDASDLDDEANVEQTRQVTAECHRQGVWVEAELGEVGGKDGVHAATARTDPVAAARYVAETGVDALAVAVGSSHARPTRDATLDLELVGRTPGRGPRAARAARLVQRAGRGAGGGRPFGSDQDQHRDPAQPGVHGRCAQAAR